jgi:hypothetical protein
MTGTLFILLDSFHRVIAGFVPAFSGAIKMPAEAIGWIAVFTIFFLWKTGRIV